MIHFLTRMTQALAVVVATGLALPAFAQDAAATPPTPTKELTDFSLGAADAKVKIVEYASFTCPHCADFHEQVFAKLKAEYIDTGKVNFTLREVYFDRYGLWAGIVARCGGDMKYFYIHDILFSTQREWAASEDPNVVVANLKKIGRSAGMEDATIDACLKDTATAEAMVARFQANMAADGVEGTPTIFVNGVKYSNMDYATLKGIIDTELAK